MKIQKTKIKCEAHANSMYDTDTGLTCFDCSEQGNIENHIKLIEAINKTTLEDVYKALDN